MYRVEMCARVRRACRVAGMSTRQASRVFGLDRKTVRKMLSFSVPPGYRRRMPRRRPKLDAFTGIIDRILEDDRTIEQRHGFHGQPAQEGAVNRQLHRRIALFAVSRLAPQCEYRFLPLARAGGRVAVENGAGGLPHHGYAYAHEGHARFHVPSLASGPAGLAQSDARGRGGRRGDGRGYGGR